jgi:hypothetical protein
MAAGGTPLTRSRDVPAHGCRSVVGHVVVEVVLFLEQPSHGAGVGFEELQQQVGDLFAAGLRWVHAVFPQVLAFPDELVALAGRDAIRPQIGAPQQDGSIDLAVLRAFDLILNDPADGKSGEKRGRSSLCAVQGAGFQWVRIPPGNLVILAGSNPGGLAGNRPGRSLGWKGSLKRFRERAGRNVSER